MKEEYKLVIAVTALITLTLLQCYAWATGHNGAITGIVSAFFSGIGFYYFGFTRGKTAQK